MPGRWLSLPPRVRLEMAASRRTWMRRGTGGGGEVEVQAGTLTLTNGARISTSSSGAGAGGQRDCDGNRGDQDRG